MLWAPVNYVVDNAMYGLEKVGSKIDALTKWAIDTGAEIADTAADVTLGMGAGLEARQ
jgi:hypothetical protein